jgi:hypothetical protein
MLRTRYWAASITLCCAFFGWAQGAAPSHNNSAALLPVDQLRRDAAFLQQTLEAVHPNLYFHLAKPDAVQRRKELEAQLAGGLTTADFYRLAATFVKQFGDDHTLVEAPDGVKSIEPEVVHRYRWKFQVLEGNIGYLDLAYMTDLADWQAFLAKTFQTIREQRLSGLVVDLRTDTGGDSRLGDDLLAYLTDKPYRSIAQKKWRFSAQWVSQLSTADPWGLEAGDPAVEPPPDFRALLRQNPPLALRRLLHDRAPPTERAILARYAPHWLDTSAPKQPENEFLTLDFSALFEPTKDGALRFTGPTCFLIGPTTFSSGVFLANTIEDFHLFPLIGAETKPCNQFGEPYRFKLPNSGLEVAVATAQYVRANGDASNPRGALPTIVVNASTSEERGAADETLSVARNWIKTALPNPTTAFPMK